MNPTLRSVLRWSGITVGALIVIVVLVLAFMDWNLLKHPIERVASAHSGRTVTIAGDLKVHIWSWTPTVTVNGLTIGNPPWEANRPMAKIERLQVQLKLLPLAKGDVILPAHGDLEIHPGKIEGLEHLAVRYDLDISRGDPQGKWIGMLGIEIDQRAARDVQLEGLIVERTLPLDAERLGILVSRVLVSLDGAVQLQFTDVVRESQLSGLDQKVSHHGQLRRPGVRGVAGGLVLESPIGPPLLVLMQVQVRPQELHARQGSG
jgi:hypothetical protein